LNDTGAIIGLTVGVVVLLLLIIAIVVVVIVAFRKRYVTEFIHIKIVGIRVQIQTDLTIYYPQA